MLYKEKEKQEIERVLQVFHDYIQESDFLDISWSDKIGFLLLKISTQRRQVEDCIVIEGAEELAYELLSEVAMDVLVMTENDHGIREADPLELQEIQRRLQHYIEKMPQYEYLVQEVFKG